jgi:hypothetical protein
MSMLSVAGRTAMRWSVWARLLLLAEVAITLKRHLDLLEPNERSELGALVAKSKGRPSNLTARERNRMRAIVEKLDPAELVKSAGRTAMLGRRK